MVAVHTRTAGRLALRRTLIQDGPGMCMPGAAACASGACERPDRMRLPGSGVHRCRSLFFSLPSRITDRLASLRAVRFSGSPAIDPAFLHPLLCLRMSCSSGAGWYALHACVGRGCSGMDIARRNPVIAAGWRYCLSRHVRAKVSMRRAATPHPDEGFCGLHDPGADGVQCARRVAYE